MVFLSDDKGGENVIVVITVVILLFAHIQGELFVRGSKCKLLNLWTYFMINILLIFGCHHKKGGEC